MVKDMTIRNVTITSLDLDQAQLERKIRLLALTTLAFQNIGHELPYSTIVSTVQIEPSQVERWVIDGTVVSICLYSLCFHTMLQSSVPAWSPAASHRKARPSTLRARPPAPSSARNGNFLSSACKHGRRVSRACSMSSQLHGDGAARRPSRMRALRNRARHPQRPRRRQQPQPEGGAMVGKRDVFPSSCIVLL